MGFASGLPLLLTISVLQAWMKEEGVDLWLTFVRESETAGDPDAVELLPRFDDPDIAVRVLAA